MKNTALFLYSFGGCKLYNTYFKERSTILIKANRPYVKKINFLGIIPGFYILTIVIILLSFSVTGEASPKFLIFHLDAVSSQNFFQYMAEGDLPNLKAVFEEGHMIHHGLSLFPGGTEMAVPHLKEGLDNSTGWPGWGYYDRNKEKAVSKIKTFFHLFSYIVLEQMSAVHNPANSFSNNSELLLCFAPEAILYSRYMDNYLLHLFPYPFQAYYML